MAAAGARGRDGPSPREFTAERHFMIVFRQEDLSKKIIGN